ncbi:hypothetical protein CHLNCDRAFT_144120 [Chlorella variabilis]|uniref:5'-Nucleotidase C-terminal domain-containing protein n=1 Tax=Chlorella variabilis TaxID=554065 RepID=E1ZBY5_CHLVA|nr:hypothetical protein CHLNCDRAFT_144120 [Chlorella variabilis]EFN56515.1 hypothetical protein CHLNCDRAFT_144120 [Chlorella variabilis]|eukprot:XP_005848617.1 hypothetical protein CHLNCDRAFT_144120 [Chlorella variabilis]
MTGSRGPILLMLALYDPADTNFGTQCEGDKVDACFGGFAKQATVIDEARQAAAARGVDTLVLHAGDQYTGTLWDAVYTKEGIQIAPEFLEMIGVQAFTLGNHEFDNGVGEGAGLAGFIANISGAFPVLSCNLDISGEPGLEGLVQPYALIDLPLANVTVGVVGLTSIDTPDTSNPGPTVQFLPYNETLPRCVADARAEGADFVILLSHIGYTDDVALAAAPAAAGVDLIVGGHSHTLLYGEPAPAGQPQVAGQPPPLLISPPTNETNTPLGPYPTLVSNPASGRTIPIVQALYASRYLGLLNTTWDRREGLVAASGGPVLLGGENSTNPVEDDPAVAARLAELYGPLEAYSEQEIGSSAVQLDGERQTVRNEETNLGDLTCAAVYEYAVQHTAIIEDNPQLAPVCLINGGVIRASIPPGTVTQGDALSVFPNGNWFVAKLVNASTMVAALNSGLSGWTGDATAPGRFPQVGGLRYAFDPSLPADARLVGAEVLADFSDGGASGATPLSSYAGDLLLLSTDYITGGGDFYDMFTPLPIFFDSSTPLAELLADYMQQHSPVNTTADGRIINCQLGASDPLCAGDGSSGGGTPASGPSAAPAPAPASAAAPGRVLQLGAAALALLVAAAALA